MSQHLENNSPRNYSNLSYYITEFLGFFLKKGVVSPIGKMASPLVGIIEKKAKHNLEKILARNDFCFALLKKLYEWDCVTEANFEYYAEVRKHHSGTEKIKTKAKFVVDKVLGKAKKTESDHAGSGVDDNKFDVSTRSYFFKSSIYVIAVAIWFSHKCYKTHSTLKSGQVTSSDEDRNSSGKIYFAKILLRRTKRIVNSTDWDEEGKDLFFRPIKCPDGFQRMRKRLIDIDSILDKCELTELINEINKIRDLVTKKSKESNLYKYHWYRSLRTQEAYEMLSDIYEAYSKCTFEPQNDWVQIKEEEENVLIFTDKLYSDDWESFLPKRKEGTEITTGHSGFSSATDSLEEDKEQIAQREHALELADNHAENSLIGKTYSFFKSNADSVSSALTDFSREIKDVARICVSSNLFFPISYEH
ncbi:hypothetical protein [Rickettsiella endosymbiont of Dermanyssus gallinae]|uniref:hypothetical protein n=1 Tax=Rickettsiella endosymbiont of Dermanyssus gallinae TaxID=2856608 RepID=UPI001C531CE2|nr:hypothetical protein [Rickettsiella endosymbiont of Dermanyssus gallinae]